MGGTLYFAWKDIPGMGRSSETVPALIMATLGHGLAHGAMAIKLRDGSYHQLMDGNGDAVEEHSVPATWQLLCFGAIFWFPLLKGGLPKMNIKHVAMLSAVATYGQCFVKKELSFSYVQTIVNIAFHISQLTLPLNDKICREYMMMPLANVFPIIVAWNEILFCDSFFRSAGGHLLYDASTLFRLLYFISIAIYTIQSLTRIILPRKSWLSPWNSEVAPYPILTFLASGKFHKMLSVNHV